MKSITYRENSVTGRILCSIFGHKFRITRHVTDHFREFKCSSCHLEVTNDISGQRISLTEEHRDIHEALMLLYRKRQVHA